MMLEPKKVVTLGAEVTAEIFSRAIERAKKDRTFRRELTENPKAALVQIADEMNLNLQIPDEFTISVVQNTVKQRYLVLPLDGDLGGEAAHSEDF